MADTNTNSGLIPLRASYDTTLLQDLNVNSPEFKLFLVRLQNDIQVANRAINTRDAALYNLDEFVCGQLYFPATGANSEPNRPVYRTVVDFGALPNSTSKSVAHGLTMTSSYTFTRIYGAASIPGSSFLPIPYSSPTAANNIELSVDGTNVTITTGSSRSSYTNCYVVLEYIKQ